MKAIILGSGQDDGIPHTSCFCEICDNARLEKIYQRLAPSLALINVAEDKCHMIDASPDIKLQMDRLCKYRKKNECSIDALLLTHSHSGHCGGLWRFGKESMDIEGLRVLCSTKMKEFLEGNYPFSLLVERGNIELNVFEVGTSFTLDGIGYQAFNVPHRDEAGDTVGYLISGERELFYLPDVDYLTEEVIEKISGADIAFIDGTFYSKDEIRRYREIPHPTMEKTMAQLTNIDTEIYFTHLNHTNPANLEGMVQKNIIDNGFYIAFDGLEIDF